MEERLQKILSQAGVASRRSAERLIAEGRVRLNGVPVTVPGMKADSGKDEIRVDGRLISCEKERVYLMLHKPRGYITSMSDPQGRPIVTDLLIGLSTRVFPVGRLDYDSEGLLLLTNDGEFALRLQHPRYGIPKRYRVKLAGRILPSTLKRLEKGVELADGPFMPDDIVLEKTNPGSTWLALTIRDGRNRVIRRAFEALGHDLARLVRVAVGPLALGSLAQGTWRFLTTGEVAAFRERGERKKEGKNCLDIPRKINNSRRK